MDERGARPIRQLSADVVGQIAAGEVVDRPAAIVKELVENSIDAGATAITVEIQDGGVGLIRVSDNGCGIPASQMKLAFARHATSKLNDADDLYRVQTLGFRGEALASICAVSKVACTTRTREADFGVCAQAEGGALVDVKEAASQQGTRFVVKDLFYNAPVRLKFLKKPSVEAGAVSDYMLRLILSRPDISFRYVSQGKNVFHSRGDGKLESAVFCCYGKDALQRMIAVHGHMNGVIVDGFVSVGEDARGNRQQQSFFVNGRYFRDDSLSRALENACQGRVMAGRYPGCVLMLTLPLQQVDVNVHPNKLELRFQNPDQVAQAVDSIVGEALAERSARDELLASPTREAAQAATFEVVALDENALLEEQNAAVQQPREDALRPVVLREREENVSLHEAVMPQGIAQRLMRQRTERGQQPSDVKDIQPPENAPQPDRADGEAEQTALLSQAERAAQPLCYVGSLFRTYLLFEAGERALLVDQHAAHERILYDKLMKRYDGPDAAQRLLTPQLVHLTAKDCALALSIQDVLAQAGFEIEPFDATSVSVRAIPCVLDHSDVRQLLFEALDEWQAQHAKLTRERVRRRVMQMACKHAIRAGDKLSDDDVRYLLTTMLDTGMSPTCPHGRPIVVELPKRELEKRFKRIP